MNGRAPRLRVVGEAVLPSFTEGGSSATDLGQGAVVAPSLLSTPYGPTGCVHGLTCYSFILLRYPAGTSLRVADPSSRRPSPATGAHQRGLLHARHGPAAQ